MVDTVGQKHMTQHSSDKIDCGFTLLPYQSKINQ